MEPARERFISRHQSIALWLLLVCANLLLPLDSLAQQQAKNGLVGSNVITGKLIDSDGPIVNASVYLNAMADEKCARLFTSRQHSEKNIQKLGACVTDLGPVNPDETGLYKFANIKPGYYALVVSWHLKDKMKKPIMAFQKGDFTISYFEGAKYNAVATGQVFYFAGTEGITKDFDYTKGEISKEVFPKSLK
jgi:hypothetical protein